MKYLHFLITLIVGVTGSIANTSLGCGHAFFDQRDEQPPYSQANNALFDRQSTPYPGDEQFDQYPPRLALALTARLSNQPATQNQPTTTQPTPYPGDEQCNIQHYHPRLALALAAHLSNQPTTQQPTPAQNPIQAPHPILPIPAQNQAS